MASATMEKRDVSPGYLGMSRSEETINAIIYGVDGDFYFYPVTAAQANLIEDWAIDGDEDDLIRALPEASEYDLDMFYVGMELVD